MLSALTEASHLLELQETIVYQIKKGYQFFLQVKILRTVGVPEARLQYSVLSSLSK